MRYKHCELSSRLVDGVVLLNSVVVDSKFRGQGWGKRAMLLFLKRYSGKAIVLFASTELGSSKEFLNKFYHSLGFKRVRGNYLLLDDNKYNFYLDKGLDIVGN